MTEEEWLDGLRGLPDSVILKVHFDLQEKIKKHYKLRDTGKNLQKAIHFCQQQIALAPLTARAMRNKHEEDWEEVNAIKRANGFSTYVFPFELPSHHGYKQYAIILKKQKELDKLAELLAKKESEGWA